MLAIPPINQTVLEGEEAQFTCAPKEPHSTVSWYKDGVPVREQTDLAQRSWITKDGTFIIQPTSMSDLGEYSCEAINVDGESQRERAFLNVQCKYLHVFQLCNTTNFLTMTSELQLNRCSYIKQSPTINF